MNPAAELTVVVLGTPAVRSAIRQTGTTRNDVASAVDQINDAASAVDQINRAANVVDQMADSLQAVIHGHDSAGMIGTLAVPVVGAVIRVMGLPDKVAAALARVRPVVGGTSAEASGADRAVPLVHSDAMIDPVVVTAGVVAAQKLDATIGLAGRGAPKGRPGVARADIAAMTARHADRTPSVVVTSAATGGRIVAATTVATMVRAAAISITTTIAGAHQTSPRAVMGDRTDTIHPRVAPVGEAGAITVTVGSGSVATVAQVTSAQTGGLAMTGRVVDAHQGVETATRSVVGGAAPRKAVVSIGPATVRSAIVTRGSGARTARRADSSPSASNAPIDR